MSFVSYSLSATVAVLAMMCSMTYCLPRDPLKSTVRVRFLVTVNDTWDPNGCMATVVTPFLVAGKIHNETGQIQVGSCDHGPLDFSVQQGSDDGYSKMSVFLTFHSSVIEDASPPTCTIPWNGSYVNPTEDNPDLSPLPSCYVEDSREGAYMTYYWFRLMDWEILPLKSTVRVRFLVTVNDTWDPNGCMATVVTPFLVAGKIHNETGQIQVGSCDHGPLDFSVQQGSDDGYSKMSVFLTFHSSVIEDASPPTCTIPWNGSYVNPTEDNPDLSPIPSCYVEDSREGAYMTYYWFRLMEWEFL